MRVREAEDDTEHDTDGVAPAERDRADGLRVDGREQLLGRRRREDVHRDAHLSEVRLECLEVGRVAERHDRAVKKAEAAKEEAAAAVRKVEGDAKASKEDKAAAEQAYKDALANPQALDYYCDLDELQR